MIDRIRFHLQGGIDGETVGRALLLVVALAFIVWSVWYIESKGNRCAKAGGVLVGRGVTCVERSSVIDLE